MSTSFQQHTTYEQSKRLKELGIPQCNGERYLSDVGSTGGYPFSVCARAPSGDTTGCVHHHLARAFTRQELEDFLMEKNLLKIESDATWCRVTLLERGEPEEGCKLWLHLEDDRESGDPFTAIFNAVVYVLEQKQS